MYEKDPKFENPVTIWFFHQELTRDPERSETWHYFMGDFRANHKRFTREDLEMGLMEKLRSHSETHFGPSSKMNPIIVRKLLECYQENDALGPLGLMRRLDKNTFEFTDVEEPLPLKDVTTLSSSY